jgi:hypothetical protein
MNSALGDGDQSKRPSLMGAGGGEDVGGVLLCMCDSEATLCKQQTKNGYTESNKNQIKGRLFTFF